LEWGDKKNRTMKYFISKSVILLSVFIGFQCSSSSEDEDPQPEVTSPPPPCQIIGFMSKHDVLGTTLDTLIFSYKNTRISSVKYGTRKNFDTPYAYKTLTYSYYKDRLPSLIEGSGIKIELGYNAQDRLASRAVTKDGGLLATDTIYYAADGKVEKIERRIGGSKTVNEVFTFDYAGGANPVKIYDQLANGPIYLYEYYCGIKPNYRFNLPVLWDSQRVDYVGFQNNVNSIRENGVPILSFEKVQFNAQNFPVSLTGTKQSAKYSEKYYYICE
jgi:hypothetical protein